MTTIDQVVQDAHQQAELTTTANVNGSEPESTRIEVDTSVLTIGDLRTFDKFQSGDSTADDLIDFLQRIVVNCDVETLPLSSLSEIMDAVGAQMQPEKN